MSKKTIKEEKIIYTCDLCTKEASENYAALNGDYCSDHGRLIGSIFDDLSRMDKERSEALVTAFLSDQEDTYEARVLEFIQKVPKQKIKK